MVLGTGEIAANTTNKNLSPVKLKFSLRGTNDGIKYSMSDGSKYNETDK